MGLYTAVVIVHGMGNSRRYDNLSHLADTLELYAQADQPTRGVWRAPEPRRWHVNLKDRDHLYYLKAKHSPDESGVGTRHVRFFEAYWAPKMAGGLPALDVLKWFAFQVPKALTHLRAPWRSFTRTRISVLHQLVEREMITRPAAQTLASLMERFSRFEHILKYPEALYRTSRLQTALGA